MTEPAPPVEPSLEIEGVLYDGRSPVGQEATLHLAGADFVLRTQEDGWQFQAKDLRLYPRIGRAQRFLMLSDGRQFVCEDRPALDRLDTRDRVERCLSALERRPWIALSTVVVTAALAVLGYRLFLPWAARLAAEGIPAELEASLAAEALETLDEYAFTPSALEQSRIEAIEAGFFELIPNDSALQDAELLFRSGVGANAFALPGGLVVVTDELVKSCTSDEVQAVLAHELGHVAKRHVLRQMLSDAGVGVLVATLTGDASSSAVLATAIPATLLELGYSRELEAEADDYAFRLLESHGKSPALFAQALECIEEHAPSEEGSFLSTHPSTKERVLRARGVEQDRTSPSR